MKLARTARFAHDFRSLPLQIQRRDAKQLQFLIDNPRHPSLRIKKMEGSQDIWEGRITKGYRFVSGAPRHVPPAADRRPRYSRRALSVNLPFTSIPTRQSLP